MPLAGFSKIVNRLWFAHGIDGNRIIYRFTWHDFLLTVKCY
jgi:hypothetical protein